MKRTSGLPVAAVCALVLLAVLAPAASAATPEAVAWVRRAATRFIAAELARDGAEACAVLTAPQRATVRGRSCAERWDGRIAALLRIPRIRNGLRADLRAVARAPVAILGERARIFLPAPLLGSSSTFLWTENCWMLER